MKDYFLIAWKNLLRRKLRSWLTIIGIFIGIAAVVALIGLGQALQTAIGSQFSDLEPDKITFTNADAGFGPPGSTSAESLTDREIRLISKVNGVEEVFGMYLEPVRLEYNGVDIFTFVLTMPMDKAQQNLIYRSFDKLEKGNLIYSSSSKKILLGNTFFTEDVFGRKINIGSTVKINGEVFSVNGILSKSGSFTKNSAIYALQDDIEDLTDQTDSYDLINIYVENQDEAEEIAEKIREIIREDRNEKIGEEGFSIETAGSNLQSIKAVLSMVNVVVIAIASIALLIGGIGVANNMFTSVLERQNEIGIMKAIGAQNYAVMSIFLFESGLLGLFGGIAGTLFGLFISWGVISIAAIFLGEGFLQMNTSLTLLLGPSLFAFVIGMIAGYIPAKQASKLSPVEALRK